MLANNRITPAQHAAVYYDGHTTEECWAAVRRTPERLQEWLTPNEVAEFSAALRELVNRPLPGGPATISIGSDS